MTPPWSVQQPNRHGRSARGWTAVLAVTATCLLAAWAAGPVLARGGARASGGAGSNVPARLPQATPTATPPGGQWSVVHAPNHNPLWTNGSPTLRAVHGVTIAGGQWVGWAVGDDGAVVRYDGADWVPSFFDGSNLVPSTSGIPPAGATNFQFRDVFVIAPDDVWVVGVNTADRFCGECGVLLHFDGSRLRNLDKSEFGVISRVAPLNAIDMVKGDDGLWYGWAVGDDASFDNIKAIILHFDAGTWDLFKGPNNIAKDLHAVKVLSPDEAWAVGEDGSESWYDEVDQPGRGWPRLGHSGVDTLYAVDLADRLYGWDGGVGGRMNRYAGSCHDNTLATQCWFDNQARPIHDETGTSLNIDVYGVDLLSRTEGWVVGAAMSRRSLVAYLDGRYWRTTTVQGDPGRSLYGLHMIDAANGIAVGADGVILRYTDDTVPSPTNTEAPPSATDDPQTTPTHDPLMTETAPTAPDGTVTATGTHTPTGTASPELTPGTPDGSPTTPETTTTTPDVTATVTATEVRLPSPTDTPTLTETPIPSATPSVTPSATPPPRVAHRLFIPLVLVAHTER